MTTSGKKIYFASDVHLGSRYLKHPAEVEKKLVKWLDEIKNDASAIYFLGDVFDYWYEYKYVAPRGHIRFLGKLAELSDLGIGIHLITGNHDIWMFDYLPSEIGLIIHRKPFTVSLLEKTFFLGHGDEVGHRPLKYRLIQHIFRSRLCQFLYATIHPRWTFVFARGWSLNSRKRGAISTEKRQKKQARNAQALEDFATSYLRTHPEIDFFMFGHLHILIDKALTPQTRILIIGDWMQHFSYAEWDGEKVTLRKYI